MMVCGLLPSRLASPIDPVSLVQYRWLLSTATPIGPTWPVMMVCGLLPSRLASPIVPPTLAQYRWAGITPVPVSETVAAAGFLLAARSVAVPVPAPVGANRTTTVHDLPGPRLTAVHASAVMVNAADPGKLTVSALVPDPPEFR